MTQVPSVEFQGASLFQLLLQVLKAAYRRLAEGGELIFNCKLKLRPGEKSLRDVINDLLLEEGKRRKDLNLPGLLIHSDNTDIAPRYSRKHIEKMVEEAGFGVCFTEEKDVHLEKIADENPTSFYALDDSSAVKVDGDIVSVVSEGEWKKFN